jgi:hypothetical protein
MSPDLTKALVLVAKHCSHIKGEWWIIGSTAARLAGCEAFDPEDVDIFGSTDVLNALLKSFACEKLASATHHQFRSDPYQRISLPGALPIEVMGGLEIFKDGRWNALTLQTRISVSGYGPLLWIPSVQEQITVFERFGRRKDLEKAEILRNFCN